MYICIWVTLSLSLSDINVCVWRLNISLPFNPETKIKLLSWLVTDMVWLPMLHHTGNSKKIHTIHQLIKKCKLCITERNQDFFFRSKNSTTLVTCRSTIFNGCKHMAMLINFKVLPSLNWTAISQTPWHCLFGLIVYCQTDNNFNPFSFTFLFCFLSFQISTSYIDFPFILSFYFSLLYFVNSAWRLH